MIIGVASQRGGIGKSEGVKEIATCLSLENKKVIVIDFDQQCSLSNIMRIKLENTISDIFQERCKIDDAIQHTKWFDMISSSAELSKIDITYTQRDDIYLLADVCEYLEKKLGYEYVLIDNSPSRNFGLNMTYVASDIILCPSDADRSSLEGIIAVERDLKALRETRDHVSHAYIRGIILGRFDSRTNANAMALKQLEKIAESLEGDVFVQTIRNSIKVTEARTVGEPLQVYERWNNAAIDYRKVTKYILGMEA